ncbi:MAG: BatA domain-containing protein, partial [Hyphomicrobiales bacterium]|nr:BatA domain-containing protein [Hyphomicrobiales bacterium]
MTLGWLAFANPLLLAALVTLPILYWLLRTVPPRPKQVEFPPTRILVGLENREKTPAKTPWWLLLIRLLAAALVIMALAEPILNPTRETALKGTGPVVIVVDNGWAAAPRWAERMRMVDRIVSEAEAGGRAVVLLPTASPAKVRAVKIEAPRDARSTAAAMQPQPFMPDRAQALAALQSVLAAGNAASPSVVWLNDGIDHKAEAGKFADGLAQIARDGTFAAIDDAAGTEAIGVFAGVGTQGKLEATLLRSGGGLRSGTVHALSARGQRLGEAQFAFAAGADTSKVVFELPLELRNQVARVELGAEQSAGAVSLLDARSQWKRIALISGENREQAQPLLAPLYYIQKALAPFSELVQPKDSNLAAGVDWVLQQNANVLVLADIGTLTGAVRDRVAEWVNKGGVLVRFAGPRLEKGGDDLLPVPLRMGGRTLGGALSWSTPQPLSAFEDSSLFAGLAVPPDVTVNRQVLADPARLGGDVAVWARLKDGTPLVTAAQRGEGKIVLFHITANSDWSNVPISGLFVEMLQRIATLGTSAPIVTEGGTGADSSSAAASSDASQVLAPLQTLDGFGVLKPPPPTAQPLTASKVLEQVADLDHPPGYYGPA